METLTLKSQGDFCDRTMVLLPRRVHIPFTTQNTLGTTGIMQDILGMGREAPQCKGSTPIVEFLVWVFLASPGWAGVFRRAGAFGSAEEGFCS